MIFRSPLPPVPIPDRTLTEHVLAGAAARADRPAVVDGLTGDLITYGELARRVELAAAGLVRLGVRSGDVVALVSHNQPLFAVALHAITAAGATVALVNPALTPAEIGHLLTISRATVAICSRQSAGAVRATGFPVLPLEDLPDGRAPLPRRDPATTAAAILFSSGTTGVTKAVRHTHRGLVANLEQTRAGWRLTEHDVLAAVLPFFHVFGFSIVLNSGLLAGATVVAMPRFDATGYLGLLRRHGVTRAYLVPPMVAALASSGETPDLPALRYAVCGAAPLDDEQRARAELVLGCPIRQGYGLTEAGGTHQTFDDDFAAGDARAVGTLSPGTEARLVEPGTRIDVAPGRPGELLIRGPQVMAGYVGEDEATAAALGDGWLSTGDLMSVDEAGRFHVLDRIKEMIKYKGYQVAPAELEALLRTHELVADAAVVGVPDAVAGEVPKAFVVLSGPLDADELISWVAARIAPYKKVRAVEFVTHVPRSVSGKILRRLLSGESACAAGPSVNRG
ncbi:4-coumarate--CoA ligase family protein [Lentzea tibetensis]|uniref:4-coumarate--CoA ligase family protein n=1 Tax=Lentzea tibetensis TaxID=2591470 RepID=A0A563EJS5_9PSEU|nr:AMP-binding protein [Lentzea tibetensis]TWP47252.1 4-coumarate--CoA ligase family protein [Lentzea tibetensis]